MGDIWDKTSISAMLDSWVYTMWECDLLDPESAAVSNGSATKQLDIQDLEALVLLKTHLGKVQLELLAVELGLVQLDSGAGGSLRGAEVYPNSPEAFEKLESGVLVIDPKQGLEPLLEDENRRKKTRRLQTFFTQQ